MEKLNTNISGVYLLKPKVFADKRGFFMESYNKNTFQNLGIRTEFIQDNHSKSAKGVLRGLHYQIKKSQTKLVRVIAGAVFDVAVDIRRGSPTYGKWFGIELNAKNKYQLYIPAGLAHGFYTLQNNSEFLYKCSEFYAPEYERTILWNDPDIGINWQLFSTPILSEKDKIGCKLNDIKPTELPEFTA